MKPDSIPRDALKPGDILLCKIPRLSLVTYLSCIVKVLKQYHRTGQFDLDMATPLIHWVIGYLDDYRYFHASFWNGSKLVESRIKGGLRENDISTYANDTVDVYRYHKDGHELGPPLLPVDPLLEKAQELVDRHWAYGFDSAYLLAILCVSRWRRGEWVDCIREFLIRHTHFPKHEEMIRLLFEKFRPQIDTLIEQLIVQALEVVRKYRDREGYVCSQTVAVIYNEAANAEYPIGTYTIKKPIYADRDELLELVALPSADEGESAGEELIEKLEKELSKLPATPVTILSAPRGMPYETCQASLREDTLYTPGDLAQSSNTKLAGRLKL